MRPDQLSSKLRQIACRIDVSEKPSRKLVAQELRMILADFGLGDPIAEVHEDKSEQLKQLALKHLSDAEAVRQQALASLEKQLKNSTWQVDKDTNGASAHLKVYLTINGVNIPVAVYVGNHTVEIRLDGTVESSEYPDGLEEAGLIESDVDEFGGAYDAEYAKYDWEPILEWLAGESGAEAAGQSAMYEHFDTEPIRDYYDLRGRG